MKKVCSTVIMHLLATGRTFVTFLRSTYEDIMGTACSIVDGRAVLVFLGPVGGTDKGTIFDLVGHVFEVDNQWIFIANRFHCNWVRRNKGILARKGYGNDRHGDVAVLFTPFKQVYQFKSWGLLSKEVIIDGSIMVHG